MAYTSKTYSLSDEVIDWLARLKELHTSVNKGLLAIMQAGGPAEIFPKAKPMPKGKQKPNGRRQ